MAPALPEGIRETPCICFLAPTGRPASSSRDSRPLCAFEGRERLNLGLTFMAEDEPVATLGRETELELVDDFLRTIPAGPSALVLHGEAGIGKSTVWNHGVVSARRSSFHVLACRPAQAESGLPYLGLGDLFAFVSDQVLAALPDPQRRSLEIALLRAEAEGSPLEQRAVAVAVLNVLLTSSRSAPLLVAIDDAQWLDVPSRRALRFALRRLPNAPIGILVVTRATVIDEDPFGLDGMIRPERVRHLTIGPLVPAAVDLLLRSRLRAPVAGQLLRRVEQASGGNPLFALELGRALLESSGGSEPGRPLTIPASLTELVGSRLARLPDEARECLLVAAALSRPSVDLIELASPRPLGVMEALTAGADAGVIELRCGSVRFVHPLLAGVLYSQATAGELRQLHRRLAYLVQDPEERARHLGLSASAPDETVADAIAEGAARAASRGAPDVAAALYEQAARLTPAGSAEEATRRRVDAADQHIALREMGRARLMLEEALADARTGVIRARALHRLGRIRALEAGFEATSPTLLDALEHVGDDVALRVAIERDLTFARAQVGDPAGAVEHARAAHRAALESGDDVLLAEALDQLCMAEFAAGNGVPPEVLERAITVDGRVGPAPAAEHPGWGSGRVLLAMMLKWTDRFDLARRLMRSLLAVFADRGDEASLDTVLFHLGELELWAGNWQATEELCRAAQDLEYRSGHAVVERRAQLLAAMLDEARGSVDAARSGGEECLELCERAADPPGLIRCCKLLGRLELSLRHPAEAVDHLLRGLEIETHAGYDPGICRIVPDAIEALIDIGRVADAERHLEGLESHGTMLDRPWAVAAAARCRALLDAAHGDLARAQAGLERAAEMHARMGQPFEHARTLLAFGIVQRRLKKKRDARQTLGRALGVFEALGAQTWSELTQAEQGRIGGRAASPRELTSTEAGVAQLVAEGLTNREVAASMFLSEKTIETNLTRIYGKLAVGSRRQLARKLRGGFRPA